MCAVIACVNSTQRAKKSSVRVLPHLWGSHLLSTVPSPYGSILSLINSFNKYVWSLLLGASHCTRYWWSHLNLQKEVEARPCNCIDKGIRLFCCWLGLSWRPPSVFSISWRLQGRHGVFKRAADTQLPVSVATPLAPTFQRWWCDFWLQPLGKIKYRERWLASFILLSQIASFIIFTHTIQGKCLFMLQRWEWASLIHASHHMALCSLSFFNTGRWFFLLFSPFRKPAPGAQPKHSSSPARKKPKLRTALSLTFRCRRISS